ncbi:MAG: carbohydrate kinase family protein [Candidatus Paceibacterota bacterium]|jgi:ribokinase
MQIFDILTIGTATRDVFLTSSLFKVLRDPKHLAQLGFITGEAECFALGSKLKVDKLVRSTGGDAANAAVTFARQGFKTAMLAKVGSDEAGKEIAQELKDEKIAILNEVHTGETDYSTILLAPGGERTVLVFRGTPLSKKEVTFSRLKAKWAYIAPGDISTSLIKEIVTLLKKQGTKIAFNPSRHYLEKSSTDVKMIIAQSDIVIMNREEAASLVDMPYKNEKGVFRKLDQLINGITIMTDGPRGAIVSDGTHVYRCGTFKENVCVDRTGAGDAFGSGFVVGFIRSNDICFALRLAAANATSVVEHIGAQEGILSENDFKNKRWQFLDLDIESR